MPFDPVPNDPPTGYAALAEAFQGRPYLADDIDDLPPVSPVARERLRDRLEAGLASGLLDLTIQQFKDVLCVFMPEDFVPSTPESPPSATLPGTAERVADYCERVRRREAVTRGRDGLVDGVAAPGGIRVLKRQNGNVKNPEIGAKVLGLAVPDPEPLPGGMYRTLKGHWVELEEAA